MSDKDGKLIPFRAPKLCGDPDVATSLREVLAETEQGTVRGVLVVVFRPPGEGAGYSISGHATQADILWMLEAVKHDVLSD